MGNTPVRERTPGKMGQSRPKVWIVGGQDVPVAELQERLGDSFEVAVVRPAPLADMGGQQAQLLIVSPDDLRKLTAAPTAASALLDSVGQGVCLMHQSGEVVWSNTRFARYDERTRQQVKNACMDALRTFQERASAAPVSSETVRRTEITVPEESRTYEVIISPANAPQDGPGKRVDAVAAIIREITSDRRLRLKMDAIDQAGAQLVRLEPEAVRKMNNFERLRLLETKIVNICKELLRFDHFSIRLMDERTGRLEIVIATGLPQEAIELEIYPKLEDNGISGYVAATGRSYICYDTERDPRFLPGLAGARSSCASSPRRFGR